MHTIDLNNLLVLERALVEAKAYVDASRARTLRMLLLAAVIIVAILLRNFL
jgi:hypothetical protein